MTKREFLQKRQLNKPQIYLHMERVQGCLWVKKTRCSKVEVRSEIVVCAYTIKCYDSSQEVYTENGSISMNCGG
jgi:hypothetical protein